MIQIPEVGFNYSANQSNVSSTAMGDWLELNILFGDQEVTKSDVVDRLIEDQICSDDSQDLARQIATDGWRELVHRQRFGGIPKSVLIDRSTIRGDDDWKNDLIRSFFVFLSALRIYPEWAKDHRDYPTQGELFERVVETICLELLPGWKTYRVGWSPNNASSVPIIIGELCSRLFVSGAVDINDWLVNGGGDGGLDIVCYRTFEDEREAAPVYFLQCASGKNWGQKLESPNTGLWQKYLNSAVRASKGIVAPFVVTDKEMKIAGLKGQVIVFDRIRMLQAVGNGNIQLEPDLQGDLIGWMCPRLEALPQTDS